MKDRLKILLDNGVISKDTMKYVELIHENLFPDIELEKSNSEEIMFWTHLAMTIERALKNEQLNDLDISMRDEIEKQDNYNIANKKVEMIEKIIGKNLNASERTYILLHVCNITRREK